MNKAMEIVSTAPNRSDQTLLWGNIDRLLRRIHESMKMSDSLMNELMFWIYKNNLQTLPKSDGDEGFRIKQSPSAHSEWVFTARDFHDKKPNNHPTLLEDIYYNDQHVQYWSNGDDLSFYQYVGTYDGQKIRIIFYNSSGVRKKSFREWASQGKYSSVRICLS